MRDASRLRQEIDEHVAGKRWIHAQTALIELWRVRPTPATASYITSRCELLRHHLPLIKWRLGLLRSFTAEPLVPILRAVSFLSGIDLTIQLGDFNAYTQEILNPASWLYSFGPDGVILAVQTRDVAPELSDRYASPNTSDVSGVVRRVVDGFEGWMKTFRSHSKAPLLVHTLEVPLFPSQGILDTQIDGGQVAAVQQINWELRRLASAHHDIYLLDYDGLVAGHGRKLWHDERKWLSVRLPLAANALLPMVQEWMKFLHPLTGKICKVLVVDLDNTLWGGVIGEDGAEGISLGIEYPGSAYQALQSAILDLYHRGILLAVCSKNNRKDAMEVLEQHPRMLLRPHHFAALKINWNDKPQNLREIATELNLGLESLAFLDDNQAELARVSTELPQVFLIPLPNDPMDYAATLRQAPVFERLKLSDEDRMRGQYYTQQHERVEMEQQAVSVDAFYRSLKQEVEIMSLNLSILARAAQLTQRTNQFNATTRRYSEQQLAEIAATPNCWTYAARVKDRFGDQGLVGLAIVRETGQVWKLDTFLLSCRVIGRTIETVLLSFLVDRARGRGVTRLEGWFFPTKKNGPARDLYPTHGFQRLEEQDGNTLWHLDLRHANIACPEWVQLTFVEEAKICE
jgi:FkbH-like protein